MRMTFVKVFQQCQNESISIRAFANICDNCLVFVLVLLAHLETHLTWPSPHFDYFVLALHRTALLSSTFSVSQVGE